MQKFFKIPVTLSVFLLVHGLTPAFAQNTVLTTSTTTLPGGGTGSENVVVGPGNSYPTANNTRFNIFIGSGAGGVTTTGYANSFVGYLAGYSNTTGNFNSFMGTDAGASNTIGNNNTFMGLQAGYFNSSGSDNLFTGYQAGWTNSTGNSNSFTGSLAGYSNTTGNYNSFTGSLAGYSNVGGNYNSFIGAAAGYNNTYGSGNTFTGNGAGYDNTTGSNNSFLGTAAGSNNTYGGNNTFTGKGAGYYNTSGGYNLFMGYETGYANVSGDNNSFIGAFAGNNNITGTSNTYIGYLSDATGINKAVLQRATALGYKALVAVNDGLVLGDTATVKVGIGTAYPNQRFTLRGNMNFLAYDNSMMLKNQPFLHFNEHESLALGLGAEIPAGAEKTLVLGSDKTSVQIPGILSTYQPSAGQFLTVNQSGKMVLSQPRVQVASVADWSDKVFEESYALRPLNEVEEFVKKNKHLPGVPSAAAMVAEGVESTAFNAKLLEKIEELTLYVVALEKKNEEVKDLRKEVSELKELILQIMPQTLPRSVSNLHE